MDCFPRWIVWTVGITVTLSGAQIMVLVGLVLRHPPENKLRYARKIDPFPRPVIWLCGVPECTHKNRFRATLHAMWERPWKLRKP